MLSIIAVWTSFIQEYNLYSHELELRVLEALGDVVDGLELRDGVLGDAGDRGVERPVLGLVAEAVLQLAEGGEEAGAVGLKLAVLAAEAELHGEPVALKGKRGI